MAHPSSLREFASSRPDAWIAGVAVTAAVASLLTTQAVAGAHDELDTPTVVTSAALSISLVLLALVNLVWGTAHVSIITAVVAAMSITMLSDLSVILVDGDGAAPTWGMAAELLLLTSVIAAVHAGPGGRRALIPLGVSIALVVACLLALAITDAAAPRRDMAVGTVLTLGLAGGYGFAAVVVHQHWPPTTISRAVAAAALLVIGADRAVSASALVPDWLVLAADGAAVLASCLLCGVLFLLVTSILRAQVEQSASLQEQLLVHQETTRQQNVDQHAMRNMVAGISMASGLLEDHELDEQMRRRLERTLQAEAEQLRLLLHHEPRTGAIPPQRPPPDEETTTGTPETSVAESPGRSDATGNR